MYSIVNWFYNISIWISNICVWNYNIFIRMYILFMKLYCIGMNESISYGILSQVRVAESDSILNSRIICDGYAAYNRCGSPYSRSSQHNQQMTFLLILSNSFCLIESRVALPLRGTSKHLDSLKPVKKLRWKGCSTNNIDININRTSQR